MCPTNEDGTSSGVLALFTRDAPSFQRLALLRPSLVHVTARYPPPLVEKYPSPLPDAKGSHLL